MHRNTSTFPSEAVVQYSNNVFDKPAFAAVQAKLKAELDKMKASSTRGCFR